MKTLDIRRMPPDVQYDIRMKAVRAVIKEKKTRIEVAKIFNVRRETVGGWVNQYQDGGFSALKTAPMGRPPGGSLKPWQAAQVVRTLTDKCPEQLKLPFYLWTRESVSVLIEKRYGVHISKWTVGRYLAQWGFTPQKPVRRAYEQDPEAVRKWLSYQYPAIRREAKKQGATIYWGDETGMRSDHAVGTSYGRCGRTPVIPGTGQRFRCNMISAITNRGELLFMVFKKRFTTNVFIDFLRRLVRQVKSLVFLIVDGHPVHRSAKVRRWIQKHRETIRMFKLPDYSPELNPDELVNQDVKSNAVGRQRPENADEMISTVRSYLRSRQRKPQLVKNYFKEEHVKYAAV